MWVLWCVGTLKIFKVPLCVGSLLWCVMTLKNFKVTLCVGSVLWCGDFENFQRAPVCEDFKKNPCAGDFFPVLERLIILEKIPVLGFFPCTGEIGFFRVKIPVLEKFFALCSKKKTLVYTMRKPLTLRKKRTQISKDH